MELDRAATDNRAHFQIHRHPELKFRVAEHPRTNIWPTILATVPPEFAVRFCCVSISLFYLRRQEGGKWLRRLWQCFI
jgi:hypothetical protein